MSLLSVHDKEIVQTKLGNTLYLPLILLLFLSPFSPLPLSFPLSPPSPFTFLLSSLLSSFTPFPPSLSFPPFPPSLLSYFSFSPFLPLLLPFYLFPSPPNPLSSSLASLPSLFFPLLLPLFLPPSPPFPLKRFKF